MSRPGPPRASSVLGTSQRQPANPSGSAGSAPRRSAGGLPGTLHGPVRSHCIRSAHFVLEGLARAASALRQSPASSSSPLLSLPAHLRTSTTPRIPSPLGKGTPNRASSASGVLPVSGTAKPTTTNPASSGPGKPASLPVRTSKTSQKHVFLPEEPQTKPLPSGVTPAVKPVARQDDAPTSTSVEEDRTDERSDAEKMSKAQREEAGLPRLTAYATAEGYKIKLLQAFLKREHGVGVVRVFDDAVYAVYTLPLLPGYGASTKVRSSPAVKSPGGVSLLERMTEAEEVGYHDGFFPQVMEEGVQQTDHTRTNEYLLSSSPQDGQSSDAQDESERKRDVSPDVDQTFHRSPSAQNIPGAADRQQHQQAEETPPADFRLSTSDPIETRLASTDPTSPTQDQQLSLAARSAAQAHLVAERERAKRRHQRGRATESSRSADRVAEVVFFEYGVTVFFGLTEREERDVLEDCESAGIWTRALEEADWEVEECHYVYDPDATYPRIYNDLFSKFSTLRSR